MKINREFKVCIILDSTFVSKSIFKLIGSLKNRPDLNINFILTPSNNQIYYAKLSLINKLFSNLDRAIWSLIQYLESIYYKRYHSDNSKHYLNFDHGDNILDLREVSLSEIEHSISNNSKLTDLNIDLTISLNLNPYCNHLKKISKLGLISFGCFEINRRNFHPIGFDEVYNKKSSTGFSILRLHENIDGIEVLFKGAFPTHNYFLSNNLNILKRRNFYLKQYIFSILNHTLIEENIEVSRLECYESFSLPPSLSKQSFYILESIKQRVLAIKNKILGKEKYWKVAFTYSDWAEFQNSNIHTIENLNNCYLADPFVINVNKKNYLLAEEYSFDTFKGTIVAYELQGKNSKRIGTIIEESFHMSFPYLFKFQNKIFMVPETSENNDIRIYESVEFPYKWKLNQVVMTNVFAVDSMIFNSQNKWWLFSNINPDGGSDACSELYIFSSDNPLSGDWKPHKLNPVIVNSDNARNGGILYKNDKIFRVSQRQDFGRYGAEFAINEIITLTKSKFIERKIMHIKPDIINNGLATHHCHSNNGITVFDFLT